MNTVIDYSTAAIDRQRDLNCNKKHFILTKLSSFIFFLYIEILQIWIYWIERHSYRISVSTEKFFENIFSFWKFSGFFCLAIERERLLEIGKYIEFQYDKIR